MTIFESAQRLAAAGHRVFPLRANSKKPASEWDNWPERATCDLAQIDQDWFDRPDNANIGLVPDLALDFDCKPGQRGAESLAMLEMMGLPATWSVRTPSGGLHMIYTLPAGIEVPNSVSKIAPNVDVRGRRGYVVAAGSVIDGKPYEDLGGALTEAPQWLIDLCGTARERTDTSAPAIELDSDAAIINATRYLQDNAPEAVEGAGGDATTYKVAARVKDFGVSEPTCWDLMCQHWNEQKAFPTWDPAELAQKVNNAYGYGSRPPGSLSAEAEFSSDGEVQITDRRREAPTQQEPRRGLYAVPFNEGRQRALTAGMKPLIKGLLDTAAMSVLYGESNSGKSFLALDFSYHVAAGAAWNGCKTTQGLVVYVAAEGGGGIFKRLEALGRHYSVEATGALPFEIIPCPVDLLRAGKAGDTEALIALVRSIEAKHAQPVALVVIDTLSRAIAGGDENAPTDMGAIVRNFDRIRTATGAHLMVVHHSGKDKARGARGHSLLRAATDTELEVDNHVITATKQRELDAGEPIRFNLKTVEIGRDADGDKVTSCIVELRDSGDFGAVDLTREESDLLELIEAAVLDKCDGDRALAAQYNFKAAFIHAIMYPTDNGAQSRGMSRMSAFVQTPISDSERMTVGRMLNTLEQKRTLRKVKRGQWVVLFEQLEQI